MSTKHRRNKHTNILKTSRSLYVIQLSNAPFLAVLMHTLQPEAWTVTFSVLQAAETSPEAKLFAATTLKGKV